MRKIISILIALGLILGLTVMATPASATVSKALVSVYTNCAGAKAAYNLTFSVTASLTEGVHAIVIEFPAGTVLPTGPCTDTAITISDLTTPLGPYNVRGKDVSVAGTTLTIVVPADIAVGATAAAPVQLLVQITVVSGPPIAWGIINPPAGTYTLKVSTSRAPDNTPVVSLPYDIVPAVSAFTFMTNWGLSYPGINPDFFAPLKASGQNETASGTTWVVHNATINTIIPGVTVDGYLNAFNLTFTYIPGLPMNPGCQAPCANMEMWFELTKAPAGSTVTLWVQNTTWYTLQLPSPPYLNFVDLGVQAITNSTVLGWEMYIHVDTLGDYEFTFHADCLIPPCCAPGSVVKVVPFTAYQWKDWAKIPIYRKWNLISLPLVPFNTDINKILAALHPAVRKDLLSVWYFDQCATTDPATGKWYAFPSGGDAALTTMTDGKAYWMKFSYNATNPAGQTMPANNMGAAAFPLYVWGTAKGAPTGWPAGPYPVCKGWNMVGLTETINTLDSVYLWNFWSVGAPLYGQIYWWNAPTQTWGSGAPIPGVLMAPNYGYWIPFSVDGAIYP